jgi:hypothetical protein
MTTIIQKQADHVRVTKGKTTWVFSVYNTPDMGGKNYHANGQSFWVDGIVPEVVVLSALYSLFII